MDLYTKETKAWLDVRFKKCSEDGIYLAHQPIYGFGKNHYEQPYASRLIPTYQIMMALSRMRFDSILDVGGAEGYKAYIAKELFGIRVVNSDLSEEACRRAEEIFHLQSTPVDIHELPFNDNAFDVILCSETLEHAADLDKALNEILRVAKKALIITIPHEDRQVTDKNVREKKLHGHRSAFDLRSFELLKSRGFSVTPKRIMSKSILYFADLLELGKKKYHKGARSPKIYYHAYNLFAGIVKIFGAKNILAFSVILDDLICKFTSSYLGICVIILKDKSCYGNKKQKISVNQIMNIKVPYYYLK